MAYTFHSAWTVSFQSETTYNWEIEEWSVPFNVAASKLVMMGKLLVSLQAGVGRWLTSPDSGPDGWQWCITPYVWAPDISEDLMVDGSVVGGGADAPRGKKR